LHVAASDRKPHYSHGGCSGLEGGTRVGFAAMPVETRCDVWKEGGATWYVCLRSGQFYVAGVRAGVIEGWLPPALGDAVEVSLDTRTGELSVSICGRTAVVCTVRCPDPLCFVIGPQEDAPVEFLEAAPPPSPTPCACAAAASAAGGAKRGAEPDDSGGMRESKRRRTDTPG
jgi:hypothetical protein